MPSRPPILVALALAIVRAAAWLVPRGDRELFRREVDRMLGVVAAAEGVPMLADGGEVVAEIHRHIDDETWKRLQAAVFAEPAAPADVA